MQSKGKKEKALRETYPKKEKDRGGCRRQRRRAMKIQGKER